MGEEQGSKLNLEQEFEKLGANIRNALQGAWSREERKKLSEEIQRGLDEVGTTLGRVVDDLQQNETVQQVSTEVDEFAERIRSGEVTQKLRAETVEVLRSLNKELEAWIQRWSKESGDEAKEA
jgi:vacuolar-type H+-ATPase subunit E/Vma4